MENGITQNSAPSKIRAIFLEVGIILLLAVLVLGVLSYLKIINLGLFTKIMPNDLSKEILLSKNDSKRLDAVNPNAEKPKSGGTEGFKNADSNPVQPRLDASSYSKKVLNFAYIVTQIEGKVTSVDTVPGTDENYKLPYSVRLVIDTGSQSAGLTLLYPKEAMSKVKVINSEKNVIDISEIKVNDVLTITTNTGLGRKYPNNINSVIILKN